MKKTILPVAGLLLIVFISGCTQAPSNDKRIVVFVSILPQADFVENVCGNLCAVNVMIPPGSSPATYDPSATQLSRLSNADIYFRIGHIPFEQVHMDAINGIKPSMKVVDTSNGIELRHINGNSHEEGNDPHIWLSPVLVKKQVDTIASALSEIRPEYKEKFMENAEMYKTKLDGLDTEIKEAVSNMPSKKFMVFHPSWGYFADEYSLEQIPIEVEGKEPTASELQKLIETAKQENIKVIFYEPQFSKQSAETIASEIGGGVKPINPLPRNYIEGMKEVVQILSEGT